MSNASNSLLLLAIFIMVAHFVTKVLLILSRRQSVYFGKKLANSFFFYNHKKIRNTLEIRVKQYYITSNRLNKIFYTMLSLSVVAYVGTFALQAIDHMQPAISRLLASL